MDEYSNSGPRCVKAGWSPREYENGSKVYIAIEYTSCLADSSVDRDSGSPATFEATSVERESSTIRLTGALGNRPTQHAVSTFKVPSIDNKAELCEIGRAHV